MKIGLKSANGADLQLAVRALGAARSVLHIGAHPDDEDVGMISYVTRKLGGRVVYWSATRGEGGQNRIGPYNNEFLGVYRTWESQQARAIGGGESLFGPFIDFGFSKNGAEALTKWGEAALVREIVRAIRMVQPQVVIGRWQGDRRDGHGHHEAVGIATRTAFAAAGDPTQFPELQADGLSAWQPCRLLFSTMGDWQPGEDGSFGHIDEELEREGALRINTGEFDPLSGATYQELGWLGFNSHRTQAMGFLPEAGEFYYYYRPGEAIDNGEFSKSDMFAGIDTGLAAIADHTAEGNEIVRRVMISVQEHSDAALKIFRADAPADAAMTIMAGLKELRELLAQIPSLAINADCQRALSYALRNLIERFNATAARCFGLRMEAVTGSWRLTPGRSYTVEARLWHDHALVDKDVTFTTLCPADWNTDISQRSSAEGVIKIAYQIGVSEMAMLSCPYWLRTPHSQYAYEWPKCPTASLPFGQSDLRVKCTVETPAGMLEFTEPVLFREGFAAGHRELEAKIVPPISIEAERRTCFLPVSNRAQAVEVNVSVTSNLQGEKAEGDLRLAVADGWTVEPVQIPFSLLKFGEVFSGRFIVTAPDAAAAGNYTLAAEAQLGDRVYKHMLSAVMMGAPGLPRQASEANCVEEEFIIEEASVLFKLMDVDFAPGLKLAYLSGAEEDICDSLAQFPINIEELSDADVRNLELDDFDAIVVGPNAYLMRDELRKNGSRLLNYVDQGGTLIVQYQGYGYAKTGCAPYPFQYAQPHDRVTLETAPVTFLQPTHSVLNYPNKMTEKDFEGWVHDRGMYFFGRADGRYEKILSCNDAGEEPKDGGLLIAGYGRGTFVYAAYSFYRQLPAGVEGAFRLFANLLSLPHARILERMSVLRKVPIFSSMSDDQIEKLARVSRDQSVDDGSYLCRQGDPGFELYVVVDGVIEILTENGDSQRLLGKCGSGEYVGEMAALAQRPRSASLRAKGKTKLLSLPGQDFRRLLHTNPGMTDNVIGVLTDRLIKAQSSAPPG